VATGRRSVHNVHAALAAAPRVINLCERLLAVVSCRREVRKKNINYIKAIHSIRKKYWGGLDYTHIHIIMIAASLRIDESPCGDHTRHKTHTYTRAYKSNDFVDLFNPTTIHLCCTTIILLLLLYQLQSNGWACVCRVVGEVYYIILYYTY